MPRSEECGEGNWGIHSFYKLCGTWLNVLSSANIFPVILSASTCLKRWKIETSRKQNKTRRVFRKPQGFNLVTFLEPGPLFLRQSSTTRVIGVEVFTIYLRNKKFIKLFVVRSPHVDFVMKMPRGIHAYKSHVVTGWLRELAAKFSVVKRKRSRKMHF